MRGRIGWCVGLAIAVAALCSTYGHGAAARAGSRSIAIVTHNQSSQYLLGRFLYQQGPDITWAHVDPGAVISAPLKAVAKPLTLQYWPSDPVNWGYDGPGITQVITVPAKATQVDVVVVDGPSGPPIIAFASITTK